MLFHFPLFKFQNTAGSVFKPPLIITVVNLKLERTITRGCVCASPWKREYQTCSLNDSVSMMGYENYFINKGRFLIKTYTKLFLKYSQSCKLMFKLVYLPLLRIGLIEVY